MNVSQLQLEDNVSAKSKKIADVGEEGEEYEILAEDPVTCHRASNYLTLGFEISDAFVLAKIRDAKGVFLYWGDIKKLMEGGATHEQVLAIYV